MPRRGIHGVPRPLFVPASKGARRRHGGVEVRYKPFDMTIDLRWLAILYPTLLALFGAILLSRKLRTHPHSEPPKKKAVKL